MEEPANDESPSAKPGEDAQERRRRRYILGLEAGAIILGAAFLVVGLTVASGLDSAALEWGVKIGAILALAMAWRAIPGIYDNYFADGQQ